MLSYKIKEFATKDRKRIAIGLTPNKAIPEDLSNADSVCDVVVVGRQIEGYQCINTEIPETILLEQLLDGSVHGAVRGQLDDTKFMEQLIDRRKIKWTDIHHVSLLKHDANEFWLAPVSNTECWIKQDKIHLLENVLRLYRALKIEPRIAVISGVRESDLGPQWYFDGMYYDSEEIVGLFQPQISGGGWIRHFKMETEHALREGANLLLMPNGMVGNQCYRLLVYTGFVQCMVNLYLGSGLNIVTNSRNETKCENYLMWAAAVANGLVPADQL